MFDKTIIRWYIDNKRELPWRNTKDPYCIWISEIILQQTRISQGHDYYLRFIEKFPDVTSLATASEDEVMKLWQGLGYYSRARNLHEAACQIVSLGHFPNSYEEVKKLKGIGDYTAAAICSFSYEQPYAVVDGNVYRVLSRYLGIETPIDTAQGKKEFSTIAQDLLDKNQPGLYNQAIMDFGALQCTPQMPNCTNCPLSDSCLAFHQNRVDVLPIKNHKTKTSNRYFNYIYVRAGKHTYINKRIDNDIWKNLYELPLIESDHTLNFDEFIQKLSHTAWIDSLENITIRCIAKNIKHVLSHRIIFASLYEIIFNKECDESFGPFVRIPVSEINLYAVPSLISLLLEKL